MSDEGKELLRELVQNTKSNTHATFALLKTIRKLEGERKKFPRSLTLGANVPTHRCYECGMDFSDFEDELHHVHWKHPDHFKAPHCPCVACRPADCGCDYCQIGHDELHGIPDKEIGESGILPID